MDNQGVVDQAHKPHEHHTTPVADTLSCGSNEMSGSIFFEFDDSRDRQIFQNIALKLCYLIAAYLLVSSITFCGSMLFYPDNQHAQLQYILLMNDMVTIDITSAIFVVSGFLTCFVFKRSVDCPRRNLYMFLWSDMWVATVITIFVATIQHILRHNMSWNSLGLTLFEGITSVRIFDIYQDPASSHSWNTFAWPVQCMLIPMYLMPNTYEYTHRLHHSFKDLGLYLIGFFCSIGIILFSTFTSLEPNTSVFYSNASNLGYRIIEYNLGVNLLYLYTCAEPFTTIMFQVFGTCETLIWVVFACVWWSEIGIVANVTEESCIRLYYVNGCMRDHAAVLLRGCVLGTCIIASAIRCLTQQPHDAKIDNILMTTLSSVLLCTPMFIVISGLLEFSFTLHAVQDNAAVISICMPSITLCIVYVYNLRCKAKIVDELMPVHERLHQDCMSVYAIMYSKCVNICSVRGRAVKSSDPNEVQET